MTQDASFVAEEDIPVSVFVKRGTGDFGMVVCGAGEVADIGVSHQGTQDTQLPGAVAPFLAALEGTSCKIYGNAKTCEVIAGAAVIAGAKLKPDANGLAIAAVATDEYSAVANNSASAINERISCTIQYGTIPA